MFDYVPVSIREDFCTALSWTLQRLLRSRQESTRVEELESIRRPLCPPGVAPGVWVLHFGFLGAHS